MKIVIAGSVTPTSSTCTCGWKLPKELTLTPAGMLKMFLTPPTVTLKGSVDAIQVSCPSCGALHLCGEARIDR